MPIAVCEDFGLGQFDEVLADIGVRRKTVFTAIVFGHGEGDPLTGGRRERAFAERAIQGQQAFNGGRACRNEAVEVRYRAKLFFDTAEELLGFFRGIRNGLRDLNSGHFYLHHLRCAGVRSSDGLKMAVAFGKIIIHL